MLFGYLIYIHIQTEKSGQSSNRIELKHKDPKHIPIYQWKVVSTAPLTHWDQG